MGRTIPPFSQRIEQGRRQWGSFRRTLPKADRQTCDQLFDDDQLHGQADAHLSRPWTFEVLSMAVLLEHELRLERLVWELQEIKASRADYDPFAPPAADPQPDTGTTSTGEMAAGPAREEGSEIESHRTKGVIQPF
jgi:hypothetical protein